MSIPLFFNRNRHILLFVFLFFSYSFYAQNDTLPKPKVRSDFWRHVQYGGGLVLNFGTDFTNVTIAPSAIYRFNPQFGFGTGIQYSYSSQKASQVNQQLAYTSNIYGVSLIGLYNPIPYLQLSLELEEVNANNKYENIFGTYNDDFWATGLFVGLGYQSNNFTFGGRFNILYDSDKDIYGNSFMPFVRVYF